MKKLHLLPYREYAASLNRKRVSAGVLFRDSTERVMLVETTYKELWDIPGGTTNPDESPWKTASRELAEEVGIQLRELRLLAVDHIPAVEGDPMPEGLAFIFDGGLVTEAEVEAITLTDPEIRSVGLFTLEEARPLVGEGLWRRIAVALRASADGHPALCDSGRTTDWRGLGQPAPSGGDGAHPA
ncbi:NUDIX hydrolase [Crossiella sp. SN42]|uniref:NUDIX domain-containing protein n=1 Tax=Crossiella sp. SN42 TaxID=2944808 RepID=UPI00207C9C87|nr:NUDIX hydrolase [Crossiella sp. SN42]MCO1575516.1 NUDIX hydrolase [Crossiella sp. SN42]